MYSVRLRILIKYLICFVFFWLGKLINLNLAKEMNDEKVFLQRLSFHLNA